VIAQRINYVWRIFATALSFSLFGLGGALVPIFATPVILLRSNNSDDRQRMARSLIQKTFYCFIVFMRSVGILTWKTEGLERLRRPKLLILANHPTLIDVVFLVAFTNNADCVVKGHLRNNLAMRGFIKLTGFMANDHGAALLDNAEQSIGNGSALIIFPEGTRTTPQQPLRFRRGAANIAIRTGTPVTPVVIRCNPITLSKQHNWYNIPSKPFHMQFEVGDDIRPEPYESLPPSLAARRMSSDLEQHFTQELNHASA